MDKLTINESTVDRSGITTHVIAEGVYELDETLVIGADVRLYFDDVVIESSADIAIYAPSAWRVFPIGGRVSVVKVGRKGGQPCTSAAE